MKLVGYFLFFYPCIKFSSYYIWDGFDLVWGMRWEWGNSVDLFTHFWVKDITFECFPHKKPSLNNYIRYTESIHLFVDCCSDFWFTQNINTENFFNCPAKFISLQWLLIASPYNALAIDNTFQSQQDSVQHFWQCCTFLTKVPEHPGFTHCLNNSL